MNTIKDRLITLFFYLSILFFIIGFNFSDTPAGGWYQQFMPGMGGRQINDITFTDSLTGYAIAGSSTFDTNYVLKTVNSGDNWNITFRVYKQLTRVVFLDNDTGYICGGGANYLIKTTNGGSNWQQINTPNGLRIVDMHVLNTSTIWIVDEYMGGDIYKTTDGGLNWTVQYSNTEPQRKIYFYNANMGFMCTGFNLYRTTDGGSNWTQIPGENGFRDMYFANSLTGWKANDTMKKTTNGGLNWATQTIPRGPNISYGIYSFSVVNPDTIWGSGGILEYPNLQDRGMLYRTTNGGNNWLFQVPDTNINIYVYLKIKFCNLLIGWAYGASKGIHTTTGGDTGFVSAVRQITINQPTDFILFQNYPNPFNPNTKIKYQLSNNDGKTRNVKLIAYDITGREIAKLADRKQRAGTYEVVFSANYGGLNLSSGVYFYSLTVDNITVDTKKMILIK